MGSRSSLGFRQPKFSEDIAWLPTWLQPCQEPLSDDHIKDTQIPSHQASNAWLPQRSTGGREDVNLLTGAEARYNSCHLLLSGSDNPLSGASPSTGNVPDFHLYISSNGLNSECISSPVCDILSRDEWNGISSMQLHANTSSEKMYVKDDMLDVQLEPKSTFLRSRSLFLPKDGKKNGKKNKAKTGCRNRMIVDIKDAVELSIAASEVLVISETVKCESTSSVCPASNIVDIALHLKQARKNWCTNGCNKGSDCEAGRLDETDLLQDLDEEIMADAYEDVGLSISPNDTSFDDMYDTCSAIKQICSMSGTVSHVPDTPGSEHQDGYDTEIQSVKLKAQEFDFDVSSSQRNFVNIFQDTGEPHLVLNTSSAEGHSEPYLHLLALPSSKVTTIQMEVTDDLQGVSAGIADRSWLHTRDSAAIEKEMHTSENLASSPQIREPENDGKENEVVRVVPDKFESRWLGGWTAKDIGVPLETEKNTNRMVPEFIFRETSFISESADHLPDQDFFTNKLEKRIDIVGSLSSVACEGLHDTLNKEMVFFQDLVSSSSFSLADPLCSVVQCSISAGNAGITVATNQSNVEKVGDHLTLVPDHGSENLHIGGTRLCDEHGHGEANVCRISGEDSGTTSRKQLTSLRRYSMGSVSNIGMPELVSSKETVGCFKSSNRKKSTYLLFPEHTSKYSAGKGCSTRQETSVRIPSTKSCEKHGDETAKDEAGLQLQHQENSCSPLILSCRTRRIQVPKTILGNAIGNESSQMGLIPEMVNSRNIHDFVDRSVMVPLPLLPPSQHPNPCEDKGPSTKKVRFSETVINTFQQSRSARSNTKAGKALKRSSQQPDLRSEDISSVTKVPTNGRKKMIFQGFEFFLTGLTSPRERQLEILIRKHGGFVAPNVPPPPNSGRYQRSRCKLQHLPIILSPKKLQTAKFLYGCALNAFLLKVNWLTESIVAGSLLPLEKYMILPNRDDPTHLRIAWPIRCAKRTYIFDRVGIMFHGKHRSCIMLAKIVKHGGGQVFKTLQPLLQSLNAGKILVGAIVTKNEDMTSRHLRQFASEQKLRMMPTSWIIDSLHSGKLIPFKEKNECFPSLEVKIPEIVTATEWSEEI